MLLLMKAVMSPNLDRSKDRIKLHLHKRAKLVREIERSWNSDIPHKARWPIGWCVLSSLVDDLSEDIPTALRASLKDVLEKRSFKDYINLGATWGPPTKYGDSRSYFASKVVLNLLKKTLMKDSDFDPQAKAIDRFRLAEKYCRVTNRRLKHYRKFDFSGRPLLNRLNVHQVFHLARRKIQNWLGPVDSEKIFTSVKFGPGGCVGLKRPFTTPYYKFVADYSVSDGAYWHSMRTFPSNDGWVRSLAQARGLIDWDHNVSCIPFETRLRLFDSQMTIANYNEVTFVDKDATTKRAIAIEPHLNVVLQLQVGGFLKSCLQRAGCDLTDQSRNQELAWIGSIQRESQDPVTIDLEMASDTLSMELVRELLPTDWWNLLDDLRSQSGKFKNEVIKWEKFSSMGNGFTFELESLIFYALAQTISDLKGTTEWFSSTFGPAFKYAYVSVFGDDIIVPNEVAGDLIEILRFSGFRVNETKSFITGPFRESCGSDFFNGVSVRPFLFERDLSRVGDLIHLHNGLKWSNLFKGETYDLGPTLTLIMSLIPGVLSKHLVGPEPTIDDTYVWREPDECHRSKFVIWDRDHQNWLVPTIRSRAVTRRGVIHYRYLQFLYSSTAGGNPLAELDENQFTPHWDLKHVNAGGSSGDVVIAGGGAGELELKGSVLLVRPCAELVRD